MQTKKRKPVRKKVAQPVSAPKRKNSKRKARNLPARIAQPKTDFAKQSRILRNQGATDFIVDDEAHSIRWHYERTDRLYEKTVAWRTFEGWSIEDKWTDRRVEFWQQMEERVIAHYGDQLFQKRLEEMGKLEEFIAAYEPYLLPLRDKDTDEIIIDDKTNLPKFALDMPKLDKFAEMWLKVHERLLLLRGEAITRSEQVGSERRITAHTVDPVSANVKLSRSDAREMAQLLLRKKREQVPSGAIDTMGEPVDDKVRSE